MRIQEQQSPHIMVSPLRELLETATPPYTEVAMRLLFCTTLCAGNHRYRLREIEFYGSDDPYTHQGDEQVSTCGGWYFHRTKPRGGNWKGGTFQGLDISFAPIGIAGGILIRGMSRCVEDHGTNDTPSTGSGQPYYCYYDGPCNCTRELLKACGVDTIKELVDQPEFQLCALTDHGILRLEEHEPLPVDNEKQHGTMEWKATSRVGLSLPEKKPNQLQARQQYHRKPLRFLSAPFETKKEKTNIQQSTIGGLYSYAMHHQDHILLPSTTGKRKRTRPVPTK